MHIRIHLMVCQAAFNAVQLTTIKGYDFTTAFGFLNHTRNIATYTSDA